MAGLLRTPVFWLALALPLATVAAGTWLVVQASGRLDASPDRVRRVAQVQTSDAARDLRAQALDLRAELELDGSDLVLAFDSAQTRLWLDVVHATDARQDRRIALERCGAGRYCAQAALADARFHLALTAEGSDWRIVGSRELGQRRIALRPAWVQP